MRQPSLPKYLWPMDVSWPYVMQRLSNAAFGKARQCAVVKNLASMQLSGRQAVAIATFLLPELIMLAAHVASYMLGEKF